MPTPIPDLNRDQTCHHYQAPSGQRCGSPALKGEYYCYHHLLKTNYKKNHRVLIDPEITCMEIPPIEDRASIFIALAAVIHRLAENTIDTRRAGQMIYGLQVAMRALEPPPVPRCRTAPAAEAPHAAAFTTSASNNHAATQPATCNSQPATRPTDNPQPATPPHTIQITKESLLYFLRSRHCYNCNTELFPADQLTERRNAGAPAEVIEEARHTLPAPQPATENLQPATVLPTLQAVAQESPIQWSHRRGWGKGKITAKKTGSSLSLLSAYGSQAYSSRIKPLALRVIPNAIALHSASRLLYTHLGARYPRDLRIRSGAALYDAPAQSNFVRE